MIIEMFGPICASEKTEFPVYADLTERTNVHKRQQPSARRPPLCIGQPCPLSLESLADQNDAYVLWIRVMVLRILSRTPAIGQLGRRDSTQLPLITEFLGIRNLERHALDLGTQAYREDLEFVLSNWESELDESTSRYPEELGKNLGHLAALVGLSPMEARVLGFVILLHAEPILETACELIGMEIPGTRAPRLIGQILAIPQQSIEAVFDEQSTLMRSGIISLELRLRADLRNLVDLITDTFARRMIMPLPDVRSVIRGFASPVPASHLGIGDYAHVRDKTALLIAYLKGAIASRTAGVNVLLYGLPGTGKSQLARVLSTEIGCELIEINPNNRNGDPVTPLRRLASHSIAQKLFAQGKTLVVFDECEEVLDGSFGIERSESLASVAQKSWINKALETNPLPAIWIANAISDFNPAVLRRFALCLEMTLPDHETRRRMITHQFKNPLENRLVERLAGHQKISPALIAQTAHIIELVSQASPDIDCNRLTLSLVNEKLKIQGSAAIAMENSCGFADIAFKTGWLNTAVDVNQIRDALQVRHQASLCLYGPPGTGKTAFGHWLSKQLDMPHLLYKASDLLSPYAGETEQSIARAFRLAAQQQAVLQIDEVDSFLQDRSKARQPWEVSQVNEFLTQMESFAGIFIASTNLFTTLDEASLRRFDIAIKLDYLRTDDAWSLFEESCSSLGLEHGEDDNALRLRQLRNLTPGDFAQAMRRSSLLRPQSASAFIDMLEAAVALKKDGHAMPIGFIQPNYADHLSTAQPRSPRLA